MSNRAFSLPNKSRVKNPCRICEQTVANKSGIQCKGACARWAHYKCLGYSPQKILDIRDGTIKVTCPCPHCNPKVPVEVVKSGKSIAKLLSDKRLGDVPNKASPSQSPRNCCSPGTSDHGLRQYRSPTKQSAPNDQKSLPQCPEQTSRTTSPCPRSPLMDNTPCVTKVYSKKPSCPVERPSEPSPRTITTPRQVPARKQFLYQPHIRKQPACQPMHAKAPCQKGELDAPCQPPEEFSVFERTSPKRSCIKTKDDFAFNPSSFEPQLFQPGAFKPDPPPCNRETCDPRCFPRLPAPPCDTTKCRMPLKKPPPSNEVDASQDPLQPDRKTPPLSQTPSQISLKSNSSPKESPKRSRVTSPLVSFSPPGCPRTSASPDKILNASSFKNARPLPNDINCPKHSQTKNEQGNNPIFPKISRSNSPQNNPASPKISFSIRPPCKNNAPCQAPLPDTSLSCCETCRNCKCSMSNPNCSSPICPKKVLAKPSPNSPPASIREVPSAPKIMGLLACSKKPCKSCKSSTCPNRKPSLRTTGAFTEKKSKSCTCLIAVRDPQNMRPAVSDSSMTKTGQSLLLSVIDQLCTTVGQLSGQLKILMSTMRING